LVQTVMLVSLYDLHSIAVGTNGNAGIIIWPTQYSSWYKR